MSASRVIRRSDAGWEGIEPREYEEEAGRHAGVARHTLLRADVEALRFETRYFEVSPGGHTSLERHAHPHVVVVLRGHGSVRLGDEAHDLAPEDIVFVAPWETHRFSADRGEPLGFLCIVDGNRDRPQPVEEEGTP